LRYGILTLIAAWLLLCGTPTPRITGHGLPDRLDDRVFWSIVTDFSEPGGYFRSDNLVSNETTFQHVIPALQQSLTPGSSAYIGVGPDQNFTYITALQPRIVFIVDIRRQNMLLHLMYKAVIEMSPTRADFLARLFSREKPDLPAVTPTAMLFAAIAQGQPDSAVFERNLREVTRRLVRIHHFTLSSEDLRALDYVYRSFFSAGPDIRYSFGRGPGWLPFPSYRDLMLETDGQNTQRSYLATEETYQTLREMELRNLIIPIVGDFAGPKALRAVGAYLKARAGSVTAFYTSNVEQYLFRGDEWQRFYSNVSSLPINDRSTFIRSFFSNVGFRTYSFQVAPFPPTTPSSSQTPRSQTLLNPIVDLLTAYQSGRIQSYRDVIEQSHQP
jgi:hypothetical protein